MIRRWFYLISGFTQDLGRPTGIESLWLQMRGFSNPTTSIQMAPWNAPWSDVAEFVGRTSFVSPDIYVFAYSWGCGHGFVTLAEELKKRGLWVSHAVLCDPVYRSKVLPTWLPLNPLSLLTVPKITVPANVLEVSWFRQRQNRPCGHDLRAAKGAVTIINECVELPLIHEQMDDAPQFRQRCLDVAESA